MGLRVAFRPSGLAGVLPVKVPAGDLIRHCVDRLLHGVDLPAHSLEKTYGQHLITKQVPETHRDGSQTLETVALDRVDPLDRDVLAVR